ncbi:MAG: glutamate 5-kinase [Desulfobacterales bacterium]|nr:glutamate 5-kinase [Desulfobacterales bacterium]
MTARKERLQIRKNTFDRVRRAVVKVGSGVLTSDQSLNTRVIRRLAREVSTLMEQGIQVILVSSGAIASGVKKMGMIERPADVPHKQAVAAIGQSGLMLEYERSFARYQKKVAQILLTRDDLCNRRRYLNARNTIHVLLDWKIVPIINENDTVVVEELKFGDNDNLAAMITHLMDAQILINLTDIDGFYDKDPMDHKDALLIPLVSKIDRGMEKAARDIPGAFGMGGMSSKIKTAKKITTSGIPMIIASGLKSNILKSLFEGRDAGTLFLPRKEKMGSRKCWIAFTLKAKGTIKVDKGAAKAIRKGGRSLLPIGIVGVKGDFGVGAAVRCIDEDEVPFASGLVNYKASDIRKLMGLRTNQIEKRLGYKHYGEVIHRDNLVVMPDDKEGAVCQ